MGRLFGFVVMLGAFGVGVMGQVLPATTAGAVCRVTLTGTKPGKNTDFIRFRREHNKPMFDEQKRQGLIVSYAYYSKPINLGPDDWDIALVVCFKNYADALDSNPEREEKFNQISLKHFGTAEARTRIMNTLNEMRDVVSSTLVREQILNPVP